MQQDTPDAAAPPNGDVPAQQPPAAEDQAEDEAAPPASPPLPPRHTPVAPGPRAERLQELYAQRLQRTLRKLGWQNFAGCYPTVAKKAEGVLRQVQSQMVDKLGEKCEVSFGARGVFVSL
jgi:kinetochore protein NNF1